MSVARLVRDVGKSPAQCYHGKPGGKEVKEVEKVRVGGLAPTFYNMEVSTNLLRPRLAVAFVAHDMHKLTGRMAAIPTDRGESEFAKMKQAARIRGVSDKQMKLTARSAIALRDIALDAGHIALAVSDGPVLQENPGMHPGSAFSWLEENDALPCASEGDVLGAMPQLVSRSVTGRLGTLLDMTEPDFETGRATIDVAWRRRNAAHGGFRQGGVDQPSDDRPRRPRRLQVRRCRGLRFRIWPGYDIPHRAMRAHYSR